MRRALLALATLAAAPALAGAPPDASSDPRESPAAVVAAATLASDVGPPPEERRALLLAVYARAPALARTVETALAAALTERGYSIVPDRGEGDPEARARSGGQDWLLRVRAGVAPGAPELTLVGELIPTWPSFFLQRRPGARAIPPRVVQARAPADAGTLLLAREERRAGGPFATLRTLGQLPGRVLALAVGDARGVGEPALVAATPAVVAVLSPDGAAMHATPARPAAAVRDPGAALAIGDFGAGRIALQRAGEPRAEVLALRGGALEPAGSLEAAPLCAGGAGPLFGAFAPGTAVFLDVVTPRPDPSAPARSARMLYGASASPARGPIAFATLGTDLSLTLLGPELAPVQPAASAADLATGSGFALADLDGDGTAELVASSPTPGGPDRIRVLAPLAKAPLLFESPPVDGAVLAAAGGDLTGDGVDDAVLAVVAAGADGELASTLLLLSADPRERP